jgi:hypothetical protein
MTIAKDIGLNIPTPYVLKKLLVEPVIGADPDLMYGVELEIENLNPEVSKGDFCVAGTVFHEDGSLRNNGGEYVTKPMKLRELQYVLNQFFRKNQFNEDNYSERCSVHVHANVGDMEWEQVKTLILVYQVFERSLFSFIGGERDKNIFCVPLYDTQLTQNLIDRKGSDVAGKWKSWEKYTALNLLPIFSQTTIEFRHMGGTCDLNRIMLWCNIIGCLFAFAKRESFEEASKYFLSLNTTSAYKEAVFRVFGEWSYVLLSLPTHEQDMEDGVLTAKYACGDKVVNKTHIWLGTAATMDAVIEAGRLIPTTRWPYQPPIIDNQTRWIRDEILNEQNEITVGRLDAWLTNQDERIV